MEKSALIDRLNEIMDDYIEDHLFDEGQAAHVQSMLADAVYQAENYASENADE